MTVLASTNLKQTVPMPEMTAELRRMLNDWRKTVGAEMPTPNPTYDPNAKPAAKSGRKRAGK